MKARGVAATLAKRRGAAYGSAMVSTPSAASTTQAPPTRTAFPATLTPVAFPPLTLDSDPTLDEVRLALAPLIATEAAFDGWTVTARDRAADAAGVDRGIAALAFPGGAVDMIDGWFAAVDAAMVGAVGPVPLNTMKIRDRITALIRARLSLVARDREALRRAHGVLALPQNIPAGAKLGWRAADTMWRAAGDTSADIAHYTKRMSLSAVYATTLAVFVNDDSVGWTETVAFLDRRIDNVMAFERAKAQQKARLENMPSLSRLIGRLRYPGR